MTAMGIRWRMRAMLRQNMDNLLVSWPIYGAVRQFQNAAAQKLFQQERARLAPSPIEQTIVTQLRRDGIAQIDFDQLVPSPAFAELSAWAESLANREDVRRDIDARISGVIPPNTKGGKYYVVRPLGDAPVYDIHDLVVRFALSTPILRIVSNYLGLLSRITALDLWYNLPTRGPEIFSQRWHRDPEDRAIVKTFLYLRDCNESNGPFCYIPGTHNAGILRHKVGRDNYPEDGVVDRKYSPEQQRVCTGKAGTLIFCDTTGFHKGGNPREGARYLFNTVYTSNASEPIVKRWTPQCTVHGALEGLDTAQQYAARFVHGSRE